jgi:hypothetical protein
MMRKPSEKNKDSFEHRWPFLFNSVIDGLNLHELEMSDMRFTWANSMPNPTYEKLDRILVFTEWEQKFLLVKVMALSRDISDHTPLLLDTGRAPSNGSQPLFKFELGCLLHDGFNDMVREIWKSVSEEVDCMRHWQAKIRRLREHLRGWAKNISGANKKAKKGLLDKLDMLDKKVEVSLLSAQEADLKQCLDNRLSQLLREEELKWYQRSKAKHLLEGDTNTKYFQLLVNGRHRKTHIFQLQDGSQNICGDSELKEYITTYYKRFVQIARGECDQDG